MILRLSILMFFILTALPFTATAFPLVPDWQGAQVAPDAENLNFDYEGIVELSNCSGSLVRFENSAADNLAMVLTNGHCLGGFDFLRPGEVVVNRPVRRTFQLLRSNGLRAGSVQASQILYATMTGTDMALYQLTTSYAEIEARYKIRPLTMAADRAAIDTPIQIVSGYWKRGYSCAIESIVHKLQEEDWMMWESIRYSRPGCEVIGGTSGSPIISSLNGKVVGVNNTGNENGQRCTANNPCEISEDGQIDYQKGYSYGQQTYWVYSCLTIDTHQIDLAMVGCKLPAPSPRLHSALLRQL